MSPLVQEGIVALVVIGAAAFVVRRIVHAVGPPSGEVVCPSCGTPGGTCETNKMSETPASPVARVRT